MRGRIEDKIREEKKIREKISGMPEFLMDYYYYLNEKTYKTKKIYIDSAIRFLNWYSNGNINSVNNEKLNKISPRVIQQFMSEIQYFDDNKELRDDAKANLYCYINAFTTFLKYNNIITDNPFDGKRIKRPNVGDNEITFLEPEEYSIVKNNILSGTGSSRARARQKPWMYRDLLLFQIPIMTGVRVTALSQISMEDIDFDKKCIYVIDKAREKKLYLDDETIELLHTWIRHRKELLKGSNDCGYLFISNRKEKMDVRSIQYIVNKYTNGINKHITPHKLRSTCATNMYRATRDIYIVAETLGHKSPATTRKYAMVDNNDRMNATEMLAKQMHGIKD